MCHATHREVSHHKSHRTALTARGGPLKRSRSDPVIILPCPTRQFNFPGQSVRAQLQDSWER